MFSHIKLSDTQKAWEVTSAWKATGTQLVWADTEDEVYERYRAPRMKEEHLEDAQPDENVMHVKQASVSSLEARGIPVLKHAVTVDLRSGDYAHIVAGDELRAYLKGEPYLKGEEWLVMVQWDEGEQMEVSVEHLRAGWVINTHAKGPSGHLRPTSMSADVSVWEAGHEEAEHDEGVVFVERAAVFRDDDGSLWLRVLPKEIIPSDKRVTQQELEFFQNLQVETEAVHVTAETNSSRSLQFLSSTPLTLRPDGMVLAEVGKLDVLMDAAG